MWCLSRLEQLYLWTYDEMRGRYLKGMFASEKATARNSDNVQRMLSEVRGELLAAALHAALQDGAAVMFGATRDQGALVVTLLHGSERAKAYPSSTPELEQCLTDLAASCGVNLSELLPKGPQTR